MSEPMMTIRQVSKLLRVGDRVVREWIRTGQLPVVNLGDSRRGKHRILSEDLQAFIAQRRVVTTRDQEPRRKHNTKARWF